MPANHTPTPYHVQPIGGQRYIEAQGPRLICDMQADQCQNPAEVSEMEANAAFIVRACNCHEELVQFAEWVLHRFDDPETGKLTERAIGPFALASARVILAKAKGQP